MPRLFIAINLPDTVIARLVSIQPPPINGLRLVTPEQMHLTLHFLGEANIESIAAALEHVKAQVFSVKLKGVGKFSTPRKTIILWAGVQVTPELLQLHATLRDALTKTGFQLESRLYTPHITLARCKTSLTSPLTDGFLAQHGAFSIPKVLITKFGLYSSTTTDNGPIYRCERSFPLDAGSK